MKKSGSYFRCGNCGKFPTFDAVTSAHFKGINDFMLCLQRQQRHWSTTMCSETFTSFRSLRMISVLSSFNAESTLACQVQEDSYRGTRGEGFSKDDRMLPFDFFNIRPTSRSEVYFSCTVNYF